MFNGGYWESLYIDLQVIVFSLPATNDSFNISRVNTSLGGQFFEAHDGQRKTDTTFERGTKPTSTFYKGRCAC